MMFRTVERVLPALRDLVRRPAADGGVEAR
jgi:hypothetical protein